MNLQRTAFPFLIGACRYDAYLLWHEPHEMKPGEIPVPVTAEDPSFLHTIIRSAAFQEGLLRLPTHVVRVEMPQSERGSYYIRVLAHPGRRKRRTIVGGMGSKSRS